MCVSIRVTYPDETKNNEDLKFGVHTLLSILSKNGVFSSPLMAANLEKLLHHEYFRKTPRLLVFSIHLENPKFKDLATMKLATQQTFYVIEKNNARF